MHPYHPEKFDELVRQNEGPRIDNDSAYSDEENCQYYWNLHKKYKAYLKDWENRNFRPDPHEAWSTRVTLGRIRAK